MRIQARHQGLWAHRSRLLAVMLLALGLPARVLMAGDAEQLVPANMNQKNDALGKRWDIDQMGQCQDGTNDAFDTAMTLNVNGRQFMCPQPMMTKDGSEFVLTMPPQGDLSVTRRIKVDAQASACRWTEVVTNTGNQQQQYNVMVNANLGGNCQSVVSDQGVSDPTTLSDKEQAIVAFQNPGHRPSVVWVLAGGKKAQRPTIQQQNNHYNFIFTWNLTLKPKETRAVTYAVLQRDFQSQPAPEELRKLTAPFTTGRWVADLPKDLRGKLVNFISGTPTLGGFQAPTLEMLYEELGASPASNDILLFSGNKTRLVGATACTKLAIESVHGEKALDLAEVAVLIGSNSKRQPLVALRDGQVLRGDIRIEGLRFTMQSGLVMEMEPDKLDRLILHELPPAPPKDADLFVETASGDRVAARAGKDADISFSTAWGPMTTPLSEVKWIRKATAGMGHVMALKNGSTFRMFLSEGTIVLDTPLFGRREFAFADLTAFYAANLRGGKADDGDEEALADKPHAKLVGGTAFLGRLDLADVHFLVDRQEVPVHAGSIRRLTNIGEESGGKTDSTRLIFKAELWDGGEVVGGIKESLLPLRSGQQTLRITPMDLVSLDGASPVVSEALRIRITALITDLGHPEWEKREAATRSLKDIGMLAKAQLTEVKEKSLDAEVKRRVETLLAGME